jgi:hypothetical protein
MNPLTKEIDTRAEPAPSMTAEDTLAQARARRLAALKAAEGLWADRTDIPKDGVQAQEQLRAEWH